MRGRHSRESWSLFLNMEQYLTWTPAFAGTAAP